ncbi:MAG: alpha/beta hydrolase [Pseudomonadota bacterium]
MNSLFRWSAAAVFSCLCISPCAGQSRIEESGCRDVRVLESTIHACLSGTGRVTVVLAAGAGLTNRTWAAVVQALRRDARVLSFDRPGLGQSPPGPLPRTPTQIAHELRALVIAMDIRGPLILVGHSMGGVHVLRYASLHPAQVQAIITLDTPPPGFEEARLKLLTKEERIERRRIRGDGLNSAPEVARHEREGSELPGEWQFLDFPRQLPLTVVVADSQNFGDLGSTEEHRQLWISESRRWLALSDQSSLVIAKESGHMIHRDQSDLVIDLIERVLASR